MKNAIIIGRNLLETITSALYENPIILFREYVQNSLDAYNYAVKNEGKAVLNDFGVDIFIDQENRKITITDNGYGIYSDEEFVKEMLSFGNSKKVDSSQFIGFRGIGRVSALPFCRELIFENKSENSKDINRCVWLGEKYRNLLNSETTDNATFEQMVKDIVEITKDSYVGDKSHYFKVEIVDYSYEIEEMLEHVDFEESLTQLLPIKYGDDFKASKKIEERYKAFMNEDLNDFMCSVKLNGNELRKNYTDEKHVLESDIIFWEIREKSSGNKKPGDKIGLMWFTFNKKIESPKGIKNDKDYGILVRSKNVLMGNNDTFASLCASSKEHVGTYRELTTTLRGVYGELLINSQNLKDNARREWFKTDEYSVYLKYVIVDFMKRLYKYRYAASGYYRLKTDEKVEKKKIELKNALIELVDIQNNKIDISDFCKGEAKEAKNTESTDAEKKETKKYSGEDMPRQAQTRRKNYDEIMLVIEEFFTKEKKYDMFLKLRAYIKKYFSD